MHNATEPFLTYYTGKLVKHVLVIRRNIRKKIAETGDGCVVHTVLIATLLIPGFLYC